MKRADRGSIAITLVFILIMLGAMSKIFMVMLTDEIRANREINFCRELLRTGGDLMTVVIKKKAFLQPQKVILPKIVFTEDSEKLTPIVQVKVLPKGLLRVVDVTLEGESIKWRLRKLFLEPPGGSNHPVYTKGIFVGRGQEKIKIPDLAQSDYLKYQNHFLPNRQLLLDEGLSGLFYIQQKGLVFPKGYKLPVTGTIRGKGVFYNNHNIIIGQDTILTDKVWILAAGNIFLEDNVRIDLGLLYAQGNIYLGHNVRVCGIIVAAKELMKSSGTIFQVDKRVLTSFITPSYFY